LKHILDDAPAFITGSMGGAASQQESKSLMDTLLGPLCAAPAPAPAPTPGEVSEEWTPERTATLQTVYLIVNLEGYRRGAEQLVSAYGEPVFISLMTELYPILFDPFVALLRHPKVDTGTFLEVILATLGRVLEVADNKVIPRSQKLHLWAAELDKAEEILLDTVRQAMEWDYAQWYEGLQWGLTALNSATSLQFEQLTQRLVGQLSPEQLASLWEEVNKLLRQCSQHRPSYEPGALTQVQPDLMPTAFLLLDEFSKIAHDNFTHARKSARKQRRTFDRSKEKLQQPRAVPSSGWSLGTPVQHIKVLAGEQDKYGMLEKLGFKRINAARNTEYAMPWDNSQATAVSIWTKHGPADEHHSKWAVPPLTSIVLVSDAALEDEAKRMGFTLLPVDLSPSYNASSYTGPKVLVGYKRGEPNMPPIRTIQHLTDDAGETVVPPDHHVLQCELWQGTSVRIAYAYCPE